MDPLGNEISVKTAIEPEEGEIVNLNNSTTLTLNLDTKRHYKHNIGDMDHSGVTEETSYGTKTKVQGGQHKYKYKNSQNPKVHNLTHHNPNPFKCILCDKTFSVENQLRKHNFVHSDENKARNACVRTTCDFKAISKTFLFNHIKEAHQGLKYNCELCGKCFTRLENFNEHQANHNGDKPFSCLQCDYCSSKPHNLKMHHLTHSNIKPFKCLLCDLSFKHQKHLKNHQGVHSEAKKNKFACNNTVYTSYTTCSFVGSSRPRLFQHIKDAHQGIRYNCEQCTYHSNYKQILNQHVAKDHDGLMYMCEKCDFQTASKYDAYRHIIVKHQGMQFRCNICKDQFERSEGLAKHKRSKHESITFSCDKCEFISINKRSAQRHTRHKTHKTPRNQNQLQV